MRFAGTKRQKPTPFLTTKAKDKLDTIRQNPINQQKKQGGDRCHYKHSQCSSAGFTPSSPGNPVDFLTDLSNKLCGRHSSHQYLPIQVLINKKWQPTPCVFRGFSIRLMANVYLNQYWLFLP
jgi:hypothetical protein